MVLCAFAIPISKIGCCNFCKRLFLKAGLRWVDRKADITHQTSNLEHHIMPSLIRKLFHKSEAPNDGLTQPQREAIVDLLNYCMYADNLVFLAEDRLITDTVAKFNWDPKIPFDQFDVRSIGNARNATESPGVPRSIPGFDKGQAWYRCSEGTSPGPVPGAFSCRWRALCGRRRRASKSEEAARIDGYAGRC